MKQQISVSYGICYKGMVSIDEWRSRIYGYYDSVEHGKVDVEGKGWYGGNGVVEDNPEETITIDFGDRTLTFLKDSAIEVKTESEQQRRLRAKEATDRIRREALSKLSDDEKEVLGLI